MDSDNLNDLMDSLLVKYGPIRGSIIVQGADLILSSGLANTAVSALATAARAYEQLCLIDAAPYN